MNKWQKVSVLAAVLTIGFLPLLGCGGDDDDTTPGKTPVKDAGPPPAEGEGEGTAGQVASITITPSRPRVVINDTVQLTAVAQDGGGNQVEGVTFAWASDNEEVATVDENGLVTGLAEGAANVTASAGGFTSLQPAVVTVIAQPEAATVEVIPKTVVVHIGKEQKFTAVAKDANGNEIAGAAFTWEVIGSGDVAGTVEADGAYTAPGIATVDTVRATATGTAVFGEATVSVEATNPVPELTELDPSTVVAGSTAITLSLVGQNFISGAAVRFGAGSPTTAFVDGTHLTAEITEAMLAQPAEVDVVVINPGPGGGPSNALKFIISPEQNPLPSITTLDPGGVPAGSGNTELAITGSDFVTGLIVEFVAANSTRTTLQLIDLVSSTELKAMIPVALLTLQATYQVYVTNPAPGGGVSAPAVFQVTETVAPESPLLTTLDPSSVEEDSGEFTLTLKGERFQNGAAVTFGADDLPTTFVSATELSAVAPASAVASPDDLDVRVLNPDAGLSNALTFSVRKKPYPKPELTSLSPGTATTIDPGFRLTARGSKFVDGVVLFFGGKPKTTAIDNPTSPTSISADISALDIQTPGTKTVFARNPNPSEDSNQLVFVVNEPNPTPTVVSVNPNQATAGANTLNLTISGTDFVNGAVAVFDTHELVTTFVGATQLTAELPKELLTSSGVFPVAVRNPPPGGGLSNAVDFTVNAPVPVLSTVFPAKAYTASSFTVFCGGGNFVQNADVSLNNINLAGKTFVSAARIKAEVDASYTSIAQPGAIPVKVTNPSPGGGSSEPKTITVVSPEAVLTKISLASAKVNDAVTLALSGTGFMSNAKVTFNNAAPDKATIQVVSATSITVEFAASSTTLASVGTLEVRVENPTPNERASQELVLNVYTAKGTVHVDSLDIMSALGGAQQIQVQVKGLGFGTDLTATFATHNVALTRISATEAILTVPAAELTAPGVKEIILASGGNNSNTVYFRVLPNNAVPATITVSPTSVGGNIAADFEITVTAGTGGFIATAEVLLNGAPLATTAVTPQPNQPITQLKGTIPPHVSWPGAYQIRVRHGGPGGGLSGPATFTFNP